ncbi:hypothetical protein HPB47_027533, partial [Ixodes persulcatus]
MGFPISPSRSSFKQTVGVVVTNVGGPGYEEPRRYSPKGTALPRPPEPDGSQRTDPAVTARAADYEVGIASQRSARSDCEKAFKEILRGKLKETIFWDQFLDIGCGAGDLTRSIVKVFGGNHRVVVATETSIEVVKVLRRNAAERDVLYEVMDIEKDVDEALKTWGRFRRIFSFYHLERASNKRLALANMRELLIDNGELFLLFQTSSNLRPLFQAIKESEKWAHVAM